MSNNDQKGKTHVWLGQDTRINTIPIPYDVISCEEAAKSINISEEEEMKSIVFKWRKAKNSDAKIGILHTLATLDVNKQFKKYLGAKDFRFLTEEELSEFDAIRGTVTPVNPKIAALPQYIDKRIFHLKSVYTNAGERNLRMRISTKNLQKLPNSEIVDFESLILTEEEQQQQEDIKSNFTQRERIRSLIRHHSPYALREALSNLGADIKKSSEFLGLNRSIMESVTIEIKQILSDFTELTIDELLTMVSEVYAIKGKPFGQVDTIWSK